MGRRSTRRRSRFDVKKKKSGFLGSRLFKLLLIVVLGLVLLLIIAYYQVIAYFESDAFRQSSEDSINEALPILHTELKDNLSIDGNSIALSNFAMAAEKYAQSLSLGKLSVDINRFALLKRRLHIESAEMDKLEVQLDLNQLFAVIPKSSGKSNFLSRDDWQLDELISRRTSMDLVIGEGDYTYKDFTLRAKPKTANKKNWTINLSGGELQTPLFLLEKAQVHSGVVDIKPDTISLKDAQLSVKPGELKAQALYKTKTKDWVCRLHATEAPIASLLNDDWKKRISGKLDARVQIKGKGGKLDILNGEVSVLNGIVEALPVLEKIEIADTYPYRHMEVQQATATVLYPYSSAQKNIIRAWLIDKIHIESSGKLIVKGHLIIKDDRGLSGTLRIGFPRMVTNALTYTPTLVEQQILSQPDESGISWVTVNISGTLDSPREDLSARVKSLLGGALMQQTGKAIDGAKELLGQAASVFTGGAKEQKDEKEDNKPDSLIEHGLKSSGKIADETLKTIF